MKIYCTVFFIAQIVIPFESCSAVISDSLLPRYKVTLFTINGNRIKGLFLNTTYSGIAIYPGSVSNWKAGKQFETVNISANNIQQIQLKKRNSLLKGILIGAGIGVSPLIASAVFGRGEGGAYVSVISFPLGLIVGSIIGAASKKKFTIAGNQNNFQRFQIKTN